MSRLLALTGAAGLWIAAAMTTSAQTPDAASSPAPNSSEPSLQDEVHALRRMIEQQSRQLDVLAREIAQLSQQVGGGDRKPAAPAPPPPAALPAPPASETASAGTSAPGGPGGGSAATPSPEAASAGNVTKHTVAKGETLTSIAKHYNIPIAELQKTNKIQDERKLQIGQTLTIPTASKASEPQTDKKENP